MDEPRAVSEWRVAVETLMPADEVGHILPPLLCVNLNIIITYNDDRDISCEKSIGSCVCVCVYVYVCVYGAYILIQKLSLFGAT